MNQKQEYTTVGEFFKSTKILFGAFILGLVNFGIVLIVLFFLNILPIGNIDSELTIYAIAVSISLFALMSFIGNLVFRNRTSKANKINNLSQKLSAYREGKLIQVVTLEASALLSMVFILILPHVMFVVVAVLSLLNMVRTFPKTSEMIEILDLSYSDQQKLNNPDHKLG